MYRADALISSGIGNKQQALIKIIHPVLKVVVQLLKGKTWTGRAQGLSVLLDIFNSTELSSISLYCGDALLVALSLLPGRIWRGQELTLEIITIIFKRLPSKILYKGSRENRKIEDNNNDVVLSKSGEWYLLDKTSSTRVEEVLCNRFKDKNVDHGHISTSPDTAMDIVESGNSDINKIHQSHISQSSSADNNSSTNYKLIHEFYTIVCSYDEQNITQQQPGAHFTFSNWHIHAQGVWNFLLYEATRGDRQYKLAVVKTLSMFPFPSGDNEDDDQSVCLYSSILPKLLSLMGNKLEVFTTDKSMPKDISLHGVVPSQPTHSNAISSMQGSSSTSTSTRTGNSNGNSTSKNAGGSASANAHKKPSVSQKFGSRYGDFSSSKARTPSSSSSLGKRVLSGVTTAATTVSVPTSITSPSTVTR